MNIRSYIGQLNYAVRRYLELRRLDKSSSNRQSPVECKLVSVSYRTALWCVPIPGQSDVFMSTCSAAIDDEFFVVHVDTEAFYRHWLAGAPLNGKRRSADCKLRCEMPSDYKYEGAVRGFSHGQTNPVPLADAGAWLDGKKARIGFTNGITRTFWLISNRAPAFPIQVHGEESAKLLHKIAGLGSGPLCFESLFKPQKMHAEITGRL